jgi:hypothetical protein
MSLTTSTMTDEQRKSIALEYLKRLDRGEDFSDLFADDAQLYFQSGDTVVVEGTSSGRAADGSPWRAGVTHAGRWCDVFEIRDDKIQRLFIYLDPDYADADTARYPWLC